MTCAACSARVERVLNRKDGVLKASVNLATEKATIEYDRSLLSLDDFKEIISAAGYEVVDDPVDPVTEDQLNMKKLVIRCCLLELYDSNHALDDLAYVCGWWS